MKSAQSVLEIHGERNHFNPADLDNFPHPAEFHPLRNRAPFRIASRIPSHLTIPLFSVPMQKLNERREEERQMRSLRLDALELKRKQQHMRALSKQERSKMTEKAERRKQKVWYDPWVVRQRRARHQVKEPQPEDVDEDTVRALEEIEMFEERMKGRKNGRTPETFLSGPCSIPTLVHGDPM
jgi:hypothetical protein